MNRPEVFLVAAVARNGVIGSGGTMPWHIPADLRHFKALTMGLPMIMGRKTFESLPGVLPGRRHIVLTRNGDWQEDGAEIAASPTAALTLANAPHVAVVGGGEIYRLFLPLAHRIELTEIDCAPAGDAYFPPLDRETWREAQRVHTPAQGRIPAFDFVTLMRDI